jgi:hypothetical protein
MAAPAWVQSSAGAVITATTGNSGNLAGVTVGNFIVLQVCQDGAGAAATVADTNSTIEHIDGTDNTMFLSAQGNTGGGVAQQAVWLGRALATTVNVDLSVPSDNDLYVQLHEFSNVSTGTTEATVIENGTAGNANNASGTTAAVSDTAVVTLGVDRLALNFIAVDDDNQASFSSFTGETGGDWVLRASFGSATGTDGAVGLQTAAMAAAGTIDGGSFTMAAADNWGVIGTALIGTTVVTPFIQLRDPWPALQSVNRSSVY